VNALSKLRLGGALILAAQVGLIAWLRHEGAAIDRAAAAAAAEARAAGARHRPANAPDTGRPVPRAAEIAAADGGPSPGSFADRFGTALKTPSLLRKITHLQDQMIAAHYASLFDRLQLSPEQRERLTALLAEKQLAKTDAEAAGNSLIGTELMIPAIAAAQQDINGQIARELGPTGYQAYYDFEMTDGLRTTVRRLEESLRYSPTPLSDTQAEALVAALDAITPAAERGGIAKFTGPSVEVATGLVTQQFSAPLPAGAAAAAQALLSQPQLAQLQILMRQQQDELQLRSQAIATLHQAQSAP
jgi:hypothetical protein